MPEAAISGCILAGGAGRRLGGRDKGFLELAHKPLIEYVVTRFEPQVHELMISANRNPQAYRCYTDNVIADSFGDYAGPLAGLAAALRACKHELLAIAPCDSPFIPTCLVQRLHMALGEACADIAVVRCNGRLQPVFALLRTGLLPSLGAFLERGERKIDSWYVEHRMAAVDFDDRAACFVNINTAEDLAAAEATLS